MSHFALRVCLAISLFSGLALGFALAADDAPAKKTPTKPKGQLPAHYSKVVDEAQRAKIYELQSQYRTQLDALTAQIIEIKAKRDAAIAAVLTPEQLAKVQKFKADSDAKKAADAAAKKAANPDSKTEAKPVDKPAAAPATSLKPTVKP